MFGWLRRKKPTRDPYTAFREHGLSVERPSIQIAQPPAERPVWGMLMEIGVSKDVVVSLLSFADGSSSLYFSSGSAIIGGHAHESVRRASAVFLATANECHLRMKPTQSSPPPAPGQVAFYARTDAGLLAIHVGESDLKTGRNPLSPVYIAGHGVITEFRKIDQSRKMGGA
jgi:hypothetical protein